MWYMIYDIRVVCKEVWKYVHTTLGVVIFGMCNSKWGNFSPLLAFFVLNIH